MKTFLRFTIIFLPPLIFTYFLMIGQIQAICKAEIDYFPLPSCVINFGKELERQGFSTILYGEYPKCDEIEKGWCETKRSEDKKILIIDGKEYLIQMSTVTPKGFNLSF